MTEQNRPLEDLNLLDVIRFLWIQKWIIFGGVCAGIALGLVFSATRPKPVPNKQVTLVFQVSPESEEFASLPDPQKLLEFLNTTAATEVFYNSALESVKGTPATKHVEAFTPAEYRALITSVERLGSDKFLLSFFVSASAYSKDFENSFVSALQALISTYNISQSAPLLELQSKLFEVNKSLSNLFVDSLLQLEKSGGRDAKNALKTYVEDARSSQGKFDAILVMLNALPPDNEVRKTLETETKRLHFRWTLLNQKLQQASDNNKVLLLLPWTQLNLQTSRVTEDKINDSFYKIAFPRVMTGIFLGLVVGLVIAGIRGFIFRHKARLEEIFAQRNTLTRSEV